MADAPDVVVVGAGLSGLECASELVRGGVTGVLVVETGGPGGPLPASQSPGWDTTAPPHYRWGTGWPAVGGRSLRWHGVVLRLEDWALADPAWPPLARSALCDPTTGGPSLYERLERDLAVWAGHSLTDDPGGGGLAGLLRSARPVPLAVRHDRHGAPRAYTPLDRCGPWARQARRDRLPRVRAGTQVLEVVARSGRLLGVRARDVATGRVEMVPARTAVLAAGTLENTRLVAQLLGDGPAPAFAGLNDHLVQGFLVRVPASALGWERPRHAFGYAAGTPADRFNVFARTRPVPRHPAEVLLDVWAMGEQLPSELDSVAFPSPAGVPWRGLVTPRLCEADRAVLDRQRSALAEVWSRLHLPPAAAPRLPDFAEAGLAFDAAQTCVAEAEVGVAVGYCWPLGAVEHEAGTLPLGGRHVTDTGELRDVAGVFVVGPAAFPRSGSANPSLTTLALARWAASHIAAR